jgi:ATP synthase protein I
MQASKRQAKKILIYQLLTTLVLSVAGLMFETVVALSILVGAGTGTLANGLLALGIFGHYHAQDPKFLMVRFYAAEMLKIFVILIAFGTAFVVIEEVNPVALLGAYFVAQVFPTVLVSQSADANKPRGS